MEKSLLVVALGVPDWHVLRQVSPSPTEGAPESGRPVRWEHEEYDGEGRLVAVYESWPRADGGLAFVKYSPFGWLLRVHDGTAPWNAPAAPRKAAEAA